MRRAWFIAAAGVSVVRLPLAVTFLYLYLDPSAALRTWSFSVLATALVTDIADGLLARRHRVVTKFGYLLDGVADRATYIAILLAVAWRDGLPVVLAYAFILRDVMLYGTRAYYPSWYTHLGRQRWIAKTHALTLRCVVTLYLGSDLACLLRPNTCASTHELLPLLALVATFAAITAYGSLWVVMREQATLHEHTPLDELE